MIKLFSVLNFRLFCIYFKIISLRTINQNFHFFFKKFVSNKKPYNIVLIGAHDGISHDSIYDLIKFDNFKGLFIEPHKIYFERLKENYKNYTNIIFENIAIHNSEVKMVLFSVKEVALINYPDWVNGLGSFDINHLLKSKIQYDDIESTPVKCETIMNILCKNKVIHPIRYLQIDTEGYDYEIIKNINFEEIKPRIIRFEYVNLNKTEIRNCLIKLRRYYYFSFYEGNDIIAVNTLNLFI